MTSVAGRRPSRAVIWLSAVVVGAGAIVAVTIRRSPTPATFRVIERLVDRVERGSSVATRDAALAATARYRWTAEQIDGQWARAAGKSGAMFRSPPLDVGTLDDVEAIAVTMRPGATGAVLLWSDGPTLAGADYARNRRALQPRADRPTTIVIPAKDIRGDPPLTLRHLFLHLLNVQRPGMMVDAIAVITRSDLFAASSSGDARVTIDGEARHVVYGSADRLVYPLDVPPRAELRFGLHTSPGDAPVRARVTMSIDGRTHTVFNRQVTGGGWQDFRSALPSGKRAVIQLTAESDPPGARALWSDLVVMAPWTEAPPPNVVLYVVDTLRADRLGLYGSKNGSSPFLDELARQSLVFQHAYAAASWTKPSVATLLTGLFPPTHGVGARYYTDALPDAAPTLQGHLRSRGYLTAQFSANAFTSTLSNLDRGFDQALAPSAFAGKNAAGGAKTGANALNDRILPWVEAHAGDTFFLYVQSLEPHEPRQAPAAGAGPFAAYDLEVATNDREIRRLYERLSSLGLARRTLFIVTSDHGEAFGEHGKWGHGLSVHEEEVRVPLIMHWPGMVKPGVMTEPVDLVDVVPTVLEYCRIPFDLGHIQGRSVVPGSRAGQLARPVFTTRFVYPDDLDVEGADHVESRAMIDFPWKLVATDDGPHGASRLELFDLADDPFEHDNRVFAEPARADRLNRALLEFLQKQADARVRFLNEYAEGGATSQPRVRTPSREALEQLKSLGYIR